MANTRLPWVPASEGLTDSKSPENVPIGQQPGRKAKEAVHNKCFKTALTSRKSLRHSNIDSHVVGAYFNTSKPHGLLNPST